MNFYQMFLLFLFNNTYYEGNEYYHVQLKNKYIDEFYNTGKERYKNILKQNYSEFKEYLSNLNSLSSDETTSYDGIHSKFYRKVRNIFEYYPENGYYHIVGDFQSNNDIFLQKEIADIILKYNMQDIKLEDLKIEILRKLDESLENYNEFYLKSKKFVPLNSRYIFRVFKKDTYKNDLNQLSHDRKLQMPIIEPIDNIVHQTIEIYDADQNFCFYDLLQDFIQQKHKEFTPKKVLILVNFDWSILILDKFLVYYHDFKNNIFDKNTLFMKIAIYIRELNFYLKRHKTKKDIENFLIGKENIKIAFRYDHMHFFCEYMGLFFNDLFKENKILKEFYERIVEFDCRMCCYAIKKLGNFE